MRRGFERRPARRHRGRVTIIACEGSKTEPGYFKAIRQALRLPKERVPIESRGGTDPLTVVEAAIRKQKEQADQQGWEKTEDSAWAVFDGEEHITNNEANWRLAIRTAAEYDIRLAVSNPCFEFWYLLHYEDYTAQLTRDRVLQRLKSCLPEYEKASVLYPVPLKERTLDALERARQIADRSPIDPLKPPNPFTGVAELVALLLSLERVI